MLQVFFFSPKKPKSRTLMSSYANVQMWTADPAGAITIPAGGQNL